nr:MAG TPA: hypothetical protein [Caudoviricetes sp.]
MVRRENTKCYFFNLRLPSGGLFKFQAHGNHLRGALLINPAREV